MGGKGGEVNGKEGEGGGGGGGVGCGRRGVGRDRGEELLKTLKGTPLAI